MRDHQSFLSSLGQRLGIELCLDEHRQCMLLLDDQLMISVRAVDGGFRLYGMLGAFPGPLPESAPTRLLSLNMILIDEGMSTAIEESTGAVMLLRRIDLAHIDDEIFYKALSTFAQWLEKIILHMNRVDGEESELPIEDFMMHKV